MGSKVNNENISQKKEKKNTPQKVLKGSVIVHEADRDHTLVPDPPNSGGFEKKNPNNEEVQRQRVELGNEDIANVVEEMELV